MDLADDGQSWHRDQRWNPSNRAIDGESDGEGGGEMKRQPGLKITAQGIVPDWFPKVLSVIEKRRREAKQKSQQAVEQCDLITREKVLKHFNSAEGAGVWNR